MKNQDLHLLNQKIAHLEDLNMFDEANKLHEKFIKESAKKKKKKKNVPNNPSLWAECKAWAKRTFDVYPCVPLTAQALSKSGWKSYENLSVGDEILTYNINEDKLEWNAINNLHFYADAQILDIEIPEKNINIKCTADHKWVLKNENALYPDKLIRTEEIDPFTAIKTHSKIALDFNSGNEYANSGNLIEDLLNSDFGTISSFLFKNCKFFTYKDPKHLQGKFIYKYNPNNQEMYDAVEIACTLLGYRIYINDKIDNDGNFTCYFSKSDAESTRNFTATESEVCDVWCPETSNHTWLMKQNDIVTITGNSAYANGAAAKRYKSKGGTWRKADSEENVKVAQMTVGGEVYETIGPSAKNLMTRINMLSFSNDLFNDFNKLDNEFLSKFESFNTSEQNAIRRALKKFDPVDKTVSPSMAPEKVNNDVNSTINQSSETKANDTTYPSNAESQWSGYLEMPYKEVIQKAKEWLLSGYETEASELIEEVSKKSKVLSLIQMQALKNHFERIKMSLAQSGRDNKLGDIQAAYELANDLISNTIRRNNINEKNILRGSSEFLTLKKAIDNLSNKSWSTFIEKAAKQIAYSILNRLASDNQNLKI